MRSLLFSTILGSVLFTSAMARADNYAIDYTTTGGDSAALIVSVTQNGIVYAVSGEHYVGPVGSVITGLSSYAGSDQLVSPTDPIVDFAGLSFSAADGIDYNLFSNNPTGPNFGYAELNSVADPVGYPPGDALISLSVSDVPEPMSIALLGTGLFGLGFIKRRSSPTA